MKQMYEYYQERNFVYTQIFNDEMFAADSMKLYQTISQVVRQGGKLLLCGNGGSAADCQHIAGEFVGRLTRERAAWPALTLCSDISILTCLGNDYSFKQIFDRQIEAFGKKEDLLIALSSSGNSGNILNAIETAKRLGIPSYVITNASGGKAAAIADNILKIPSSNTQVVQEVTMVLFHCLCEMLENE